MLVGLPSLSLAQNVSFVGKLDGVNHVFVANLASGGDVTQLTDGPNTDASPEWSFDGTRLTFQRNGPGMGFAVMTMNADGSGLRNLSPQGQDLLPAWTPDGRIVFSQVLQQPSSPFNIPITALMIMNADGSGRTPLVTPSPASVFNLAAHVSPDGTKIAFECGPNAGSPLQICEVNSDGSGLSFLTGVQGEVSADPHWSPDGAKIIFNSTRAGSVNLFAMNPDGSDVAQLTSLAAPYEAQDAGFSPDLALIAFEWDNGGNEGSNPDAPAELWIIDADGTQQHTLGISCAEAGCAPRFQPMETHF